MDTDGQGSTCLQVFTSDTVDLAILGWDSLQDCYSEYVLED